MPAAAGKEKRDEAIRASGARQASVAELGTARGARGGPTLRDRVWLWGEVHRQEQLRQAGPDAGAEGKGDRPARDQGPVRERRARTPAAQAIRDDQAALSPGRRAGPSGAG